MDSRSYCLITPVRDASAYARRALDAVLGQTEPPTRWVLVDDGSRDDTPKIVAEYARKYPSLQVVTRRTPGTLRDGPGIIEAFYAGFRAAEAERYPFVGLLQMDAVPGADYFETLLDQMEHDPRLGACSGKPYVPGPGNEDGDPAGRLMRERCGDEQPSPAAMLVRRACFEAIGGFVPQPMWDAIAGHRCRMFGWIARSWDAEHLRFVRLGKGAYDTADALTERQEAGRAQWYMGTGLAYHTASCLLQLAHPPRVSGAATAWWAYVRAMLADRPRYEDPLFRRFLRGYQRTCLLRGKSGATRRIHRQQAPIWTREHGASQKTTGAINAAEPPSEAINKTRPNTPPPGAKPA